MTNATGGLQNNTTTASLFHETMKHRNELMRREAGYQRTIKELKGEIDKMATQMSELRSSVKVLLEATAATHLTNDKSPASTTTVINTFNNDTLRRV